MMKSALWAPCQDVVFEDGQNGFITATGKLDPLVHAFH
jgi:hypothetical protein